MALKFIIIAFLIFSIIPAIIPVLKIKINAKIIIFAFAFAL